MVRYGSAYGSLWFGFEEYRVDAALTPRENWVLGNHPGFHVDSYHIGREHRNIFRDRRKDLNLFRFEGEHRKIAVRVDGVGVCLRTDWGICFPHWALLLLIIVP